MKVFFKWLGILVSAAVFTACGSGSSTEVQSHALAGTDPLNPPISGGAHTGREVLLFNGLGVDTSDWQTTEKILKNHGVDYALANSKQMDAMSIAELGTFGAIVIPGGYGNTIANNLAAATRLRIREAVQIYGVGYVGFCAGAWVAVGPEAKSTVDANYGFAVAPGSQLVLYRPGGKVPTAAIVQTKFATGGARALVWWGGPYTPEWTNGVVARYSTGEPAISQIYSGKGLVVISGPHPEAPASWWSESGNDPDGLDQDVALNMIYAALDKAPLATF